MDDERRQVAETGRNEDPSFRVGKRVCCRCILLFEAIKSERRFLSPQSFLPSRPRASFTIRCGAMIRAMGFGKSSKYGHGTAQQLRIHAEYDPDAPTLRATVAQLARGRCRAKHSPQGTRRLVTRQSYCNSILVRSGSQTATHWPVVILLIV